MRDHAPNFRSELKDFLRFLRRPRLAPRLAAPRRLGNSLQADWLAGLSPLRLLQWALVLWAWNLLFLGPLAVAAAQAGGAQHRLLEMSSIPWLQALLWAPLIEELVFRHGLRRIGQALWLVPVAAVALFNGPQWATGLLVAMLLLVLWLPQRRPGTAQASALPWRWRRRYRAWFPWAFYAATTLFAVIHLHNFNLNQTPAWLLPLLVLPQWFTGLVLGWVRVRRGIGAAILMHAIFNGGPLLLVWLLLGTMPGAV